jgi:carbonic anhydrase/acetyltransferase-like protein (isoleucine patch superfamily)
MSMKKIHDVYIADTARVRGDVILGRHVSIWYGVSIRGDVARVQIGQGANVQDNAVIHCDHGHPNLIGSHVTIGHSAIVHGRRIGDGSLIGINAIVLGGTTIGQRCLIAAGAVVPPNLNVPDDMVVMGVPGRILRPTTDAEKEYLRILPPRYIEMGELHSQHPDDPRVREWNGNV